MAAVGIDPVDHRDPVADLVHGQRQHALLLLIAAGGCLGGMRVDRERADPGDRGDVAQMLAIAPLVDREIVVERQQAGRNHARGPEVVEAWHGAPLAAISRSRDLIERRQP